MVVVVVVVVVVAAVAVEAICIADISEGCNRLATLTPALHPPLAQTLEAIRGALKDRFSLADGAAFEDTLRRCANDNLGAALVPLCPSPLHVAVFELPPSSSRPAPPPSHSKTHGHLRRRGAAADLFDLFPRGPKDPRTPRTPRASSPSTPTRCRYKDAL